MTEVPQPDRVVTPTPTPVDPPHDEPPDGTFPGAEALPAGEAETRKQDTIRDEIRAGWCRALRRGA